MPFENLSLEKSMCKFSHAKHSTKRYECVFFSIARIRVSIEYEQEKDTKPFIKSVTTVIIRTPGATFKMRIESTICNTYNTKKHWWLNLNATWLQFVSTSEILKCEFIWAMAFVAKVHLHINATTSMIEIVSNGCRTLWTKTVFVPNMKCRIAFIINKTNAR